MLMQTTKVFRCSTVAVMVTTKEELKAH